MTNLKKAYYIKKIIHLIKKPENHLIGELATDCTGENVSMRDRNACRFCLMGAVWNVMPTDGSRDTIMSVIRKEIRLSTKWLSIVIFNDNVTHGTVLSLLRKLERKLRGAENDKNHRV